MKTNLTKESFVEELANSLSHLYDPGFLRRSILLSHFGLDQKSNPIAALQNILTKAIESLKPPESVPSGTTAWQIYHILYSRYVEQFIQREVANDLALSVRQLRRKEKTALQVLADQLWSQYKLEEKVETISAVKPVRPVIEPNIPTDIQLPGWEQELEWLEKTAATEPINAQNLIEGIVETIRPLAQSLGVSVELAIAENCPMLNVQVTTVRQALLYIVATAVRFVPQGYVEINTQVCSGRIGVQLQVKAQRGSAFLIDANRGKELEFARKLLQMSRTSLEATIEVSSSIPFKASVILPVAQHIPILVIDDNPDLLGLVQRYLSNTRYEFYGTSDPHSALALAEQVEPEIILLDVMLPGIDGWELVGRLREHPQLRRSTIIVCTILPQEQLALTLGAAGFIRKPIRRQELLAALDRQMDQLSREASSSA